MTYGEFLPVTGGSFSALSLAWGISSNNWLVVGVGVISLLFCAIQLGRLVVGERKKDSEEP